MVLALAGITWARPSAADELCPTTLVGSTTVTNDNLTVLRSTLPALQAGDVLVQLNSYALRRCDDLERALSEAEAQHLIPMLVVRRDGAIRTLALELPTPTATPAPPTPTEIPPTATLRVLPPTAVPPSTEAAAPAPAAIPAPAENAAVPAAAPPAAVPPADVPPVAAPALVPTLLAFADNIRRPLQRPEPFVTRLAALRRTYDAQTAQSPAAAAAARPIIAYYETVAAILQYKEERPEDEVPDDSTTRRVTGSRRQPDILFDYTSTGPVPAWLAQYPFLEESVIRAPSGPLLGSGFEIPGRWIPDDAVNLLLDRARQESAALQY